MNIFANAGMYAYSKSQFLRSIYRNIKYFQLADTLPSNPCHDDVWVVAYPKSGITWFGFLISNINLRMSGIDQDVTWFNNSFFFPDVHMCKAKINLSHPLKFPGFRIIKSHSAYNCFYGQIFYLIRDPRDVMVSSYHYSQNFCSNPNKELTLEEFVHSKAGIRSWLRHVKSWTDCQHWHRINFIKYEDLKKDPKSTLWQFYSLLGFDIDDDILQEAIQASSFENMSKREEDYNRNVYRYISECSTLSKNAKFMRQGLAQGKRNTELSPELNKYICDIAYEQMSNFGYV